MPARCIRRFRLCAPVKVGWWWWWFVCVYVVVGGGGVFLTDKIGGLQIDLVFCS